MLALIRSQVFTPGDAGTAALCCVIRFLVLQTYLGALGLLRRRPTPWIGPASKEGVPCGTPLHRSQGSPLADRGRLGRVSVELTFHLSGAWQARNAITSLVRDARGLTSSVVIAARVMQPRGSTIAGFVVAYRSCGYGVMSAPHHRVHVGLTHVGRTSVVRTGSGDPWPDSVGGEGWVGSHPFPQLQVRPNGCERKVRRGSCFRTAAAMHRVGGLMVDQRFLRTTVIGLDRSSSWRP